MRIIKEVNSEKTHKCKRCESIFAYTAKDIDYAWFESIKCPVCGAIEKISMFDKKVK